MGLLSKISFSIALLCGGFTLALSPMLLHAQVLESIETALSITSSPQTPRPYQDVTLTAQNNLFRLESATLTWRIDGAVVTRGTGITEITTTTGPLGSAQTVSVEAVAADGRFSRAERTIRPTVVEILWEADTYVPSFYRGRALHTAGSRVTLAAEAYLHTASGRLDPDSLIYTWRRNGVILGEQSGRGARNITIENPGVLRDMVVSVDVSSAGGSLHGRGFTTVSVEQPMLRIYEAHPLLGVRYENAQRGTAEILGDELTIAAEPYFFSGAPRDADMSFSWTIDGQPVETDVRGALVLRPQGAGGEADVRLMVRNAQKLLQSARTALTVTF